MEREEKQQTDSSNDPSSNKPVDVKKKKFQFRITTTLILALVCAVLAAGIAGLTLNDYIKENPSFCATCHNMESHVESYMTSDHLDNIHMQAGVMCKDCHSAFTIVDETQSLIKYVTGDYKEIFSKRKYDGSMCLQCHISMDYQAEQTSDLTRNPHDSHYPDLECTTCHVAHGDQVDYCAQCHDNGGQTMIEDINTHTTATVTATKTATATSTKTATPVPTETAAEAASESGIDATSEPIDATPNATDDAGVTPDGTEETPSETEITETPDAAGTPVNTDGTVTP